jgi:hypothetical protein
MMSKQYFMQMTDTSSYSKDADALQQAIDLIVNLFHCMGLKTNPTKTKAMVCAPHPTTARIRTPAYKQKMGDQTEQTYTECK